MKQTAVEWFTQELDKRHCVILNYPEYQKLFEQAKEIEKAQIIDAHGDEQSHLQDDGSWRTVTAEQYYNETFKSE